MQECVESTGEFVVSGGDATELFEPIEESLEVAHLVAVPVDAAFGVAVAPWD